MFDVIYVYISIDRASLHNPLVGSNECDLETSLSEQISESRSGDVYRPNVL